MFPSLSSRLLGLAAVLIVLVFCSASRIQSQDVSFKLQVLGQVNGLRVQTDIPGGLVASFGGYGGFHVDAPSNPGGRFAVTESGRVGIGTPLPGSQLQLAVPGSGNPIGAMTVDVDSFSTFGNALASHFFRVRDIGANGPSAFMIRGDGYVGIGTDAPAEKLTVAGMVQSTSGGLQFPDGSVQTAAAATNSTYTKTCGSIVGLSDTVQSVCHLNLPSGTYMLAATIELMNTANYFGQNNNRAARCQFTGENLAAIGAIDIAGLAKTTMTMYSVVPITSGGVDVNCSADPSEVFALNRRLTATQLVGSVVVQ